MKSPTWLRQFARKFTSQPVRTYRHTSTKANLRLDEIEERVVPATVTWINAASGSWHTGSNWSGGVVPGTGDDVVIPDLGTPGANQTISFNGGSTTVQSITNAETMLITNGTLTLSGGTQTFSSSAAVTLGSSTLVGATIAAGTTIAATSSTLNGVTVNGTVNIAGGGRGAVTTVLGDLTVNGAINIGTGQNFTFTAGAGATQTVSGSGTISMSGWGGGNECQIMQSGASHTVVFESGVTVQAVINPSGGTSNTFGSTYQNFGPVTPVAGKWVTRGTLTATGGSFLYFGDGTFTNDSTGVWAAAGGTLNLGGNWSNTAGGKIQVTNGALNLYGSFAQATLGTLERTGGSVNVYGTLTGGLALNAGTGSWNLLLGGTFADGTLTTADGTQLVATVATLSNARIDGTLTIAGGGRGAVTTVLGDLTVNGAINIGSSQNFTFAAGAGATQTVSGSGTISMSGWGGGNECQIMQSGASHTVVFESGVTVQAVINPSGGTLNYFGSTYANFGPVTPVAGKWVNRGTWKTNSGDFLFYDGTFTNDVGGVWHVGGNTFSVAGTWTNAGTISQSGGTLNVTNTTTRTKLGTLTQTGGTTNLTGTLDLEGLSLTVPTTWNVNGGSTIIGGTLATTGSGQFAFARGVTSTLNNVTLNGTAAVLGASAGGAGTLRVLGDLTVNGSLTMGTEVRTIFSAAAGATQKLLGAGLVTFQGGANFQSDLVQQGGSHTVETYATVQVTGSNFQAGFVSGGDLAGTWKNYGTWTIPTGGAVNFNPGATFNNESGGTWGVDGGTLTLNSTWDNNGTLRVTGGTLNLGGAFTNADVGTFARTGGTAGTVNITGTLNNTSLDLNAVTGTWQLNGGTIVGGAVTTTGSGVRLDLARGATSTLNNVTVAGTAFVLGASAGGAGTLRVLGDLTVNGSLTMGTEVRTIFSAAAGATQKLLGAGLVTFQGGANFQSDLVQQGGSHTVETYATVQVTGANFHAGYVSGGDLAGTWKNYGTWTVPAGGAANFYAGSTFVNELGGTWAADGGTLSLNGLWSNPAGTIRVTAGTLNLGGSFAAANLGTWNRTGGTVNLTGTVTGGLTLTTPLGSWNFLGGTIKNGTYAVAAGSSAKLVATSTKSYLDNVVLANPLDMSTSGVVVTALNGLTINTVQPIGPSNLTGNATFSFQGTQTVRTDGGGEFAFSNAVGNYLGSTGAVETLTIAKGVTVRGGLGSIGTNNSTLYNQGTILAQSTNTTESLSVILGNNGRNEGTISGSGNIVRVYGTSGGPVWTNLGTISMAGNGTLQLGLDPSEFWANLGTITVTGSTLNLRANVTQAKLGTLVRDASSVVRLESNGVYSGDLNLDDATGSWYLAGGRFQNGTLTTSGSAKLYGTATQSLLSNVVLNGTLDLTGWNEKTQTYANIANVYVEKGITLNTTLLVGAPNGLQYGLFAFRDGPQTLTGSGTVVYGPHPNNSTSSFGIDGQLTIDSGITLRGASAIFSGFTSLINRGKMVADVAMVNGSFDVKPVSFSNLGTVRAANGGTVLVHPTTTFTNYTDKTLSGTTYTGSLTGGTWSVGAGSTVRTYLNNTTSYQFNRVNADLTLDGGNSNFYGGQASTSFATVDALSPVTAVGADGSLALLNGRSLSAPGAFTNAGNLTVDVGGTFGIAAPAAPATTGLVSRYLAEGTANDSVGSNPGSAPNGVTYTPGIAGQAFALNGTNQYISVPDSVSLRTPDVTVEGWFRFASTAGTQMLFARSFGSGTAESYGTWYAGGNLNAVVANAAGGDVISVAFTPTVGAWYHIAYTFSDSADTQTFYVNGAQLKTGTSTRSIAYDTRPLSFGMEYENNVPSYFFNGSIDQVGVWNRALSAADVLGIYNYTTVVGTSFTQTGGSTVLNGTLVSATATLAGGTLQGTGTVEGNLTSTFGTIAPGNSPGKLNVTGNYVQGPGATLNLELAGRDPNVPQFDRLRVTGTAEFQPGTTVRVAMLDGFEAAAGDNFSVVTSAALLLPLANQAPVNYQLPAPGGTGRQLAPVQVGNALELQTQQVPPLDFISATTAAGALAADAASYREVTLDSAGNTYAVGVFRGTVDFDRENGVSGGPDTLTATGQDGFVAKYDGKGALLWVARLDGAGATASMVSVAIDERGNANPADDRVFVGGSYAASAAYILNGSTLGTETGGASSGLLLWLNSDGTYTGQRRFTNANATVDAVAVAPTGNVVVTGSFLSAIDLNEGFTGFSLTAPAVGAINAYVAEFAPAVDPSNFDFAFVRGGRFGGAVSATGRDVAVGADGSVWTSGSFVGKSVAGLAVLTASSASDAYLLKLQGSGTGFTTVVARSYGGIGNDFGESVAADAAGNVVLGGSFEFSVDFDDSANRAFTLVSSGDSDSYLLKLAPNGDFLWARPTGGYRDDALADLALDPEGNVYSTGVFTDTVDFNPLDGTYYLSTAPGTLNQAYLQKLDPSGRFLWAAQLGNNVTADVRAYGLDVDATGRVVSVGEFSGTMDLDPSASAAIRTVPAGTTGGYVSNLKQKAIPTAAITGLPVGTVSEGASLALAASVADPDSNYFTYDWSVTRNGVDYAAGTGSALGLYLADQGVYAVQLTVTDESGNSITTAATFTAVNAAPVWNATTYDANPTVFAGSAGKDDNAPTAVVAKSNGVLVGIAARDVSGFANAGTVEVYTPAGKLVQTLTAPPATLAANASFGAAVALTPGIVYDGVGPLPTGTPAYAIVGSPSESNGGRVYVYSLVTGAVVQTLVGPAAAAGDRFGASVALVGNLLAVGAPGRAGGVGAAYLFDPLSGALLQTFYNPSASPSDGYGTAVAAVGANVLIGAPGDDSAGLDAGAFYLHDPGTGLVRKTLVNPFPTYPGSGFGSVVAASGLRAAVGAPLDDSLGTDAGGVHLYDLDPASPRFGGLLKTFRNPNPSPNGGKFGTSVALTGNRLLVGAESDGTTLATSGSAFLLDADTGSPTVGTNLRTFKKATAVAGDRFGAAVAFAGDDVLIGAPQDDAGNTDAGRVFRFNATAFATLSAATVSENGKLTVKGSFTDAGTQDAHTVVIDWGMAGTTATTLKLAAGTTSFSATTTYLDDNPTSTSSDAAAIQVRVLDESADVLAFNPSNSNFDRYDGSTSALVGNFASGVSGLSTSVAVGPSGDLFVSTATAIARYSGSTGLSLGTFADVSVIAPGATLRGLAFGPTGDVYAVAADAAATRVLRFDGRSGNYLGVVLSTPTVAGVPPVLIAFAADGNLYVVTNNGAAVSSSVRKYSAAGVLLSTFVADTGLTGVTGMTFAADGNLYLAGTVGGAKHVERYDGGTGAYLGTLAELTAASDYRLLATADGSLYATGTVVGTSPGVLKYDVYAGTSSGTFAAGHGGLFAALPPLDEATGSVTITNTPPTVQVEAVANPGGSPAGAYTFLATARDAGTLDTLAYSWTVTVSGTGATVTTPFGTSSPSFTFVPTGATAISVALTVTDDDTGSVTSRTQVLVGTANPDAITVNNGSAVVNGATTTYTAGTTRVVVFGLAGDDAINGGGVTSVQLELIGGFGNDTLTGGSLDDRLTGNSPGDYALAYAGDTGNDSLAAGAGNDTLDGGLGNDTMFGGTGNDRYIQVSGSADLLSEQSASGTDTIDYAQSYFGITFSLAKTEIAQVVNPLDPLADQHTVEIRGQFENLDGSGYEDELLGNNVGNAIGGGGGNDRIFGGDLISLVDAILTGDGDDSLAGGLGNDTVTGGTGNDVIFGGDLFPTAPDVAGLLAEDDSLFGGLGNDTITGGTGNDVIFGGDLLGSFSGYNIVALAEDDSISGGLGNDTITGGTGNDVIFGGDLLAAAGDFVATTLEDDSILGGLGNDTITGGTGNDVIFGGDLLGSFTPTFPGMNLAENDSLVGGLGNDTLSGGLGNDVIFGGDLLSSATSLVSTALEDDSLVGGLGNDTLSGGLGNDVIFGGDLLAATASIVGLLNEDDSLLGGLGNDTITGGTGNDVIFGGDLLGSATSLVVTALEDDSLVGGLGNDTLSGGLGNDVIFGGDLLVIDPLLAGLDVDSILGGLGNDTVSGGTGNDVIFGGDLYDLVANVAGILAEDDSLVGGLGNDTISGGLGNDVIFGGDLLNLSELLAVSDFDSLMGGLGNDTLSGGLGNDVIFGGEGDDQLTGGVQTAGPQTDLFEGGSGTDRITEVNDFDVTLAATTITIGGVLERFYDIEQAAIGGGASANLLDASAFGGSVLISGGAGDDTLRGSAFGDQLFGGSGNDSLVGGAGADFLDPGTGNDVADGGVDNDNYTILLGGTDTIVDSQGIDSVDLSSSAFAVDVDLTRALNPVFDTSGNTVAFALNTVENVRGSSYADTIRGDGNRNIIEGGGGLDLLEGRAGDDNVQGSFPQLVYLDFDSATGKGEYAYTIEDRNLIQARLEAAYGAPFSITFTQTAPSIGRFTTIQFNAGSSEDTEALIAGLAYELDWRNFNAGSRADVNVNGFLGRRGQPAASSGNFVALTATVAAHELGHLIGLRHSDAFGPIGVNPATGLPYGVYAGLAAKSRVQDELVFGTPGAGATVGYRFGNSPTLVAPTTLPGNSQPNAFASPTGTIYDGTTAVATFVISTGGAVALTPVGSPQRGVVAAAFDPDSGGLTLAWTTLPAASSIRVSYYYDAYRPGYRGPDDAVETPRHLLGSPASVGTSVADALGQPYFGERELIKLAFADASTSSRESSFPTAPAGGTLGTARNLGTLPGLAVPTITDPTAVNYNRNLNVQALSVVGTINLTGGGVSENDVYAIQATGGQFLTAEVLSFSIQQRATNPIDSVVRVYNSGGQLVGYYGGTAVNDDGFDNQDALLQDVLLPTTGTYYVMVDTFTGAGVPDTDTGDYELFLYLYTPPTANAARVGGAGDGLVGGAGSDVLIGSSGDDIFEGDLSEDIFVGYIAATDTNGPVNAPPSAAVTLSTATPLTNDVLAATVATTDPNGNPVTLTYQWYVNGALVQTTANSKSLTDTFDLAPAGHGNRGDQVSVTVTPFDGTSSGTPVSAVAVVQNSTPTLGVTLAPTVARTNDTLTVTAVTSDADSDPVAKNYVWSINGQPVLEATGPTFDLSMAGNRGDTVTVTVTAADGLSASAPASASLVVLNTAPAATGGSATLPEDGSFKASVGADADGDALAFQLTQSPAFGSVAYDASAKTFTYTPNANYFGADSFRYTLSDGSESNTVAAVDLTVTPVSDAPVAKNATASTPEDTAANGTITATDIDSANLTYSLATTPTNGTVTIQAGGTYTYTPNANYNGPDAFTFTVSDGALTSTGTVSLVVTPVNDAPAAKNATSATSEDTVLNGGLTATDVDSTSLSYAVAGGPSKGTVTIQPNGAYAYTPNANYFGSDAFSFTVTDGEFASTGTMNVTVTPVNDAPTATSVSVSTAEDTASSSTFIVNDIDSTGLTIVVASGPTKGTVALLPNGSYTYTPNANYFGNDAFTFTASDGEYSASATVSIAVSPVNDAPVAQPANASASEDTALNGVLAASDVDSTNLTFAIHTAPSKGTVTVQSNGSYTYTPFADYFGSDSFTFTVGDGEAASNAVVSVAVAAVNDAPVATPATASTAEDTALGGQLAASDVDSTGLTYAVFSGPTNGTVSIQADGKYTYTPNADYFGNDSFTFAVSDGALSSKAAVNIAVTPVNDAPVAKTASPAALEDTVLNGVLVATDIDSAELTYAVATGPTKGTVAILPNGSYTYTPAPNYNGSDSFTFTASDGKATSAPAQVSIAVAPVNDAPTAANVTASTPEDTAVNGVLAGSDIDSSGLTYAVVTGPTKGTVTILPNGSYGYTPGANYNGSDTFTYSVSDGQFTATASATVTVTPVNDAPVATGDSYTLPRATVLTVPAPGVRGNDTDVELQTLTVVSNTPASHGAVTVSPDGSFVYTPTGNYVGPDSFTYTVSDGAGGSATATVSLNVTPVLAVSIAGTPATIAEGTPVALGSSVIDPGAGLVYSWTVRKNGTVFATGSNATIGFTPNDNGVYAVTLNVTSSTGSAADTVSFTATNVPPTATGVSGPTTLVAGQSGTFNVVNPQDVSAADAAALKYSFATSLGGLAADYGSASSTNAFTTSFAAAGTYTLYARVYDPDGGVVTVTTSLTITAQNAQIYAVNGELFATASAGSDTLTIQSTTSGILVTLNGVASGPFTGVNRILVSGGAGDDFITVDPGVTVAVELRGDDGNDTLLGGSGSDTLVGGVGDDSLQATSGNDVLYGGDGNDTLRAGAGNDRIYGEGGNDSLIGASGNDTLDGGSGNDTLRAGAGIDLVFGGDGNDSLVGGSGVDTLDGGAGDDTLRSGSGADTLFGGAGNDALLGGSGSDYLDGGTGNDTIDAGSGDDIIYGGDGNDAIDAGSGDDTAFGNAGQDHMDGGAGADVLVGGAGNDVISGGAGNDVLIGGLGADQLIGNAQEDILVAGYTIYDFNLNTLDQIRRTWNNGNSYQSRVQALSATLIEDCTVFDDGAADTLTGSQGTDWFFANVNGSGVRDTIVDLGGQEAVEDVDP